MTRQKISFLSGCWISMMLTLAACLDEPAIEPASYIKLIGTSKQEQALDLIVRETGELIILGNTTVDGDLDLMITRLNPDGVELSSFIWGNQWTDDGGAMVQGNNHFWVLSTQSFRPGNSDMHLVQFGLEANFLDSLSFPLQENQEESRQIISLKDGGYLCLGTSTWQEGNDSRSAIYLFKLNPNGSLIWPEGRLFQQTGQSLSAVSALELMEDATGGEGFLILGETGQTSGDQINTDVLLIHIDINGNLVNTQSLGTSENEHPIGLVDVGDNTYLISGNKETGPATQSSCFTLLVDDQLQEIIFQDLLAQNFVASDFAPLPDGSFLLAGSTKQNEGDWDMAMLKINRHGSSLWADGPKEFGYQNDEFGVKARAVPSNSGYNLVLLGTVDFLNDNSMIGLIKTDSNGNL